MPFQRATGIGIHWSIEPTPADKDMLKVSGCKVVQLPYALALNRPDVPYWLSSNGYSIILRILREDYPSGGFDGLLVNLEHMEQENRLAWLIFLNEPDNAYDATYTSADWGNRATPQGMAAVWARRYDMAQFVSVYRRSGLKTRICSGALTARTPNPSAPPVPGMYTWGRILYDIAQRYDARAIHVYTDGYRSPVDLERLQWILQTQAGLWDAPLIVDECGINTGPDTERVSGYIALAEWLLRPEQQQAGHLGALVEVLVPFISNGTGIGWNPGYLIKSRAAYEAIGRFVSG